MSLGRSIIITIVGLCAASTSAQIPGKRTPQQLQASYDAHKGDFDYLLGDWEFSAVSREFGNFRGYWSAVRLDGGHILDEYRVVGDKGETFYVTSTLRSYNKVLDRWELVGMDAGNGLQDVGTGRRVGVEMHIEQRFGVMRAISLRRGGFGTTTSSPIDSRGPPTAQPTAARRGR
jgi:hypothetical protein